MTPQLVSVHGGHSGEFCSHAQDDLEAIVKTYIERGFTWVGLTEHMPPVTDEFRYPDEQDLGLNTQDLYTRFAKYNETARRLQRTYASRLEIFVGFETESHPGYEAAVKKLITEFQPDYIVGSLHHVHALPIDMTEALYQAAAQQVGGLDALYCAYFDQQYELINTLKPAVVGHFDLIRLFDPDYPRRLQQPEIWQRIRRNLKRIKDLDLILDFNLRALSKGAAEPYISRPILLEARDLGIAVAPGDDSHGVSSVGLNFDTGIGILQELGFDIIWRKPINRGTGRKK
ncbi:MAG TPA: histidinol-phosphatase [Anaerolineae bacterium]|jgi:histidinol-phosphatase (PHP family)